MSSLSQWIREEVTSTPIAVGCRRLSGCTGGAFGFLRETTTEPSA